MLPQAMIVIMKERKCTFDLNVCKKSEGMNLNESTVVGH